MAKRVALHPEDIKAGIRKRFGSLTAFERQKGLPEGSAADVLRGRSVSCTAEAIAEALGVPFKAVSPNQKHIRTRVRRNTTSGNSDSHRLNEGAN